MVLVFIASFPDVVSSLRNQPTHQLLLHILANVCQMCSEQRQKDNTYENISPEIFTQFLKMELWLFYLSISFLGSSASVWEFCPHMAERKWASSLMYLFLSGHWSITSGPHSCDFNFNYPHNGPISKFSHIGDWCINIWILGEHTIQFITVVHNGARIHNYMTMKLLLLTCTLHCLFTFIILQMILDWGRLQRSADYWLNGWGPLLWNCYIM